MEVPHRPKYPRVPLRSSANPGTAATANRCQSTAGLEEAKAFAATIPDNLKPETDVFFWSEFNQGTGTEVTTGSRPSDELKKAVLEYDAIQNPFDKVLAENEIASEYKVRGTKLDKLIDFAKGVETEASPLSDLMMSQFATLEERANGGLCQG
jgi:hypothetical protein